MPMGAPGATLKVPVGTYEFGANLISSKVSQLTPLLLLHDSTCACCVRVQEQCGSCVAIACMTKFSQQCRAT